MDPQLLATFLAVLDAGRISAAAKIVHLSQPAVTAQIRKLEDLLGAPLFLRSVHGVAPTLAARRLATFARDSQHLLDDLLRDVRGTAEPTGPLAIAASTTIAAHILPALLARFRAEYGSDTPLQISIGNTEEVVTQVRTGRVPLGLVEGHARAAGIRLEPFVDDEIVPIVGRTAGFVVRRARDFAAVPILWREAGSGTRAVVERALAAAGVRRREAAHHDLVLASTEAILGCAVAGLGVAFVSRSSARAHLEADLVKPIAGTGLVIRRTFRWALPAGALTGVAARFHAFAQRAAVVA